MRPRCWRKRARKTACRSFVGGSGLYFKALTRGLSAVPPIPPEMREGVRARLERDGVEALHAELARRDPASAERLKPRDRTRIARALEVVEATGRSLTDWHRDGLPPLLPPGTFSALFLAPDRDELYARIDARFDAMLKAGALEEVAAACGATPRSAAAGDEGPWRAGADPASQRRDHAATRRPTIGRADTRHYAKRQFTWFRHQLPEFEWVKPEAAGEWLAAVIPGRSEGPDPESRDSGFARSRAPRNDGSGLRMAETANSPSPSAKNPAKLSKSRAERCLPLDFRGLGSMFRATFGKSERPYA